ncbi:MAG: recombinase RecT [Ramlibacter sp.]|nr:recombinase RecT [Ramlibacter sp.]
MNAPLRAAETTALSTGHDAPEYRTATIAPTGRDLILHTDNLNAMVRVADLMAASRQMVPKHLRGNPGGCMAVTMQAMRWNMDPFALAVKTYTVDENGPVAYEGQAIIAALNNSPLLATRLSFSWEGQWERIVGKFKMVESKTKEDKDGKPKRYIVPAWDFDKDEEGLKVIVSATLVGEKEPRTLELLMKQARTRNSPLWTEDPKQQLAYLAGRRWGRLHAPDVIMGVYTPDEIEEFVPPKDMGHAEVVAPAEPPLPPGLIKQAEKAASEGVSAYQKFWGDAGPVNRALLRGQHERLKEVATKADSGRTLDTDAPAAAPPTAAASNEAGPPDLESLSGVIAAMESSKNIDALDVAADWGKELRSAADREAAAKRYAELAPTFKP